MKRIPKKRRGRQTKQQTKSFMGQTRKKPKKPSTTEPNEAQPSIAKPSAAKRSQEVFSTNGKEERMTKNRKQAVQTDERVIVESPNMGEVSVTIEGVTPLLVNALSDTAKQSMPVAGERHTGKVGNKKTQPVRSDKDRMDGARHIIDSKTDGFPASGITRAMVETCKVLEGLTMTDARKGLFCVCSSHESGLVPITCKGGPVMSVVWGLLANTRNKPPIKIVRPCYKNWSMTFVLTWDENLITRDSVLNILQRVGTLGIGAWSTTKNGSYGKFKIGAVKEMRRRS